MTALSALERGTLLELERVGLSVLELAGLSALERAALSVLEPTAPSTHFATDAHALELVAFFSHFALVERLIPEHAAPYLSPEVMVVVEFELAFVAAAADLHEPFGFAA